MQRNDLQGQVDSYQLKMALHSAFAWQCDRDDCSPLNLKECQLCEHTLYAFKNIQRPWFIHIKLQYSVCFKDNPATKVYLFPLVANKQLDVTQQEKAHTNTQISSEPPQDSCYKESINKSIMLIRSLLICPSVKREPRNWLKCVVMSWRKTITGYYSDTVSVRIGKDCGYPTQLSP